ncbi:uncharacterized [Tachysurus ichikawai]
MLFYNEQLEPDSFLFVVVKQRSVTGDTGYGTRCHNRNNASYGRQAPGGLGTGKFGSMQGYSGGSVGETIKG